MSSWHKKSQRIWILIEPALTLHFRRIVQMVSIRPHPLPSLKLLARSSSTLHALRCSFITFNLLPCFSIVALIIFYVAHIRLIRPIPRTPVWGGFRIAESRIEFDQPRVPTRIAPPRDQLCVHAFSSTIPATDI